VAVYAHQREVMSGNAVGSSTEQVEKLDPNLPGKHFVAGWDPWEPNPLVYDPSKNVMFDIPDIFDWGKGALDVEG